MKSYKYTVYGIDGLIRDYTCSSPSQAAILYTAYCIENALDRTIFSIENEEGDTWEVVKLECILQQCAGRL